MMNSEDLEILCSALSIREKERPSGTLATNLKEKGERLLSLCLKVSEGVEIEALEVEFWVQIHNLPLLCMTEDAEEPLMRSLRVDLLRTGKITTMLLRYERLQDYCFKCSRLGHQLKDCSELGDGKEATTEAMARLNVWLRTESPPKRFNHRSSPFERKSWGHQGESSSGGRSGIGSKQRSQIGELQHLEPNTNLMRNDSAINAFKEKTLSRDKAIEVKFIVRKGKEVQLPKAVIGKEKKGKFPGLSVGQMMVDQEVVLCPAGEPTQESQMNVDQATVLGISSETDQHINDPKPTECYETIPKVMPLSHFGPNKSTGLEGDKGSQSEVKKAKVSGVIEQSRSDIGKVMSFELQNVLRKEEIPPSQEEVQQQVPQLGSVTSSESREPGSSGTPYFSIRKDSIFNQPLVGAQNFLDDFRSKNDNSTFLPRPPDLLADIWSPSNLNSFKINCMAIIDFVNRRSGIGIVTRNHDGIVLSSCSLFQDSGMDFVSANAVAILKGIQFGKNYGLLPFCVESDATNVVKLINLGIPVNSRYGNIVSDIHNIMIEQSLSFISSGKKGSNKTAYALARHALLHKKDLIWKRHTR
ncbi:hypothetical protein EZV62_012612 [Acer yangbiense]|uniref:CCHC-type domain-containing protein n=1 Tax=Acer yangbiense TaxID=1000413 RepID=A0A5C7HX37_9ROSI|nr:hypothetical protein EZV62_012612 [Acer yangbiense]